MNDVIDRMERGGTCLQPDPLPEDILLSKDPDGTTTRERDEDKDRGPGEGGEARPLHLLPVKEERRGEVFKRKLAEEPQKIDLESLPETSSQRETSVNMRGDGRRET